MKVESLVIADQHAAVNWSLVLVHTARHATKICFVGSFYTWYHLAEMMRHLCLCYSKSGLETIAR
jgi:hypothetical protein